MPVTSFNIYRFKEYRIVFLDFEISLQLVKEPSADGCDKKRNRVDITRDWGWSIFFDVRFFSQLERHSLKKRVTSWPAAFLKCQNHR